MRMLDVVLSPDFAESLPMAEYLVDRVGEKPQQGILRCRCENVLKTRTILRRSFQCRNP